MSNIASKINRINDAKLNIKNAIEDKGVDMTDVAFENYAEKIGEIEGGGAGGAAYEDYARGFYSGVGQSRNFQSAWERSLKVNISEIERNSTNTYKRGLKQYPDGELDGVIIPYGTTKVGEYAFYDWRTNNQPLVIPDSVTSIEYRAFENWFANNQPLVIPDSISLINGEVFSYWTSNNQPLVIPNSVSRIQNYSFKAWRANTHPLVIPDRVSSIGIETFNDWQQVPYVEMQRTTPPTLANSNAFDKRNDAPIYVPDESVDTYKNATNWAKLANRIKGISELSA